MNKIKSGLWDRRRCDFAFEHRQVSKQHCQIYFDENNKKVFVVDGVLSFSFGECSRVRVSLNGVFVDGVRVENGEIKELSAGNEISVVCGNEGVCSVGVRIGFVVDRIVIHANPFNVIGESGSSKLVNAGLLSSKCRRILSSDDPVLYIRECSTNPCKLRAKYVSRNRLKNNYCFTPAKFSSRPASKSHSCEGLTINGSKNTCLSNAGRQNLHTSYGHNCTASDSNAELLRCSVNGDHLQQSVNVRVPIGNSLSIDNPRDIYTCEEKFVQSDELLKPKKRGVCVPPPGNKFYLNRLHFMDNCPSDEVNVTLPELLYPVETLKQIFIATFTSDLSWFLSYCEIPAHLPIAVACHNAERCWSSSPDKRTLRPYSNFPNLVVIYPQFPEVISFGKERKKFGIGCHHPKLFVLQRDDTIRVIITSANLVAKQWLQVTNTVWWQDFPHANVPDYVSLFAKSSTEEVNLDSKSDFAAQLAGFMATLLVGVPDQAHWILELTKFDFSNALGHLVASVPGIYSPKHPYISESLHYLTDDRCTPRPLKCMLLGSVEASVVGISHLFRTSADTNGALLKRLALVIGKCHVNAYGLLEIILRRNLNIATDANAISVAISNSEELSDGDCIQVGFLPRDVAKWVAPLSDAGLLAFSAYIYPKEVLACALEGSNNKAHLILYAYQGPNFFNISKLVSPALASAMCSLVASIQRCSGLWRLHEILGHYKWPEQWETDFTFGSSSVGAVNAPFLAAFSAATGKRSLQLSESEESDPDWGCWSASQELRNPSIRIIFPTIERVKTASCGIWASKYILCFSQKTWLSLKHLGILHDAIPHPIDRIRHPMHVKVARRRFQSRTDTSSFGWVYCGSHNFSAAAWGRPIHSSPVIKSNEDSRSKSVLGSRLHICNYEFGIVFIVPPSENKHHTEKHQSNLDDITLPFVIPAPRYRPMDTPATKFAMSNAFAALAVQERERNVESVDVEEEIPDEEEEVLEVPNVLIEEKEDDKVYAEKLWGSN
ncbi:hypothetical protein L1987_08172 [Smallanthus sonchifolius]|uniref:Uncharacterized protein n=1 Tax=Smallanthus sonchifolius TaxID=185202 RepID=A0ACB9JKB2_9ASTR|nr:hypothetical protein L1987_08172 [Smallanthus sonchifolius]